MDKLAKFAVIIFAWYFLVTGYGSGASTNFQYTVVGPFSDEITCGKISNLVYKKGQYLFLSPCWEYTEKTIKEVPEIKRQIYLPFLFSLKLNSRNV